MTDRKLGFVYKWWPRKKS